MAKGEPLLKDLPHQDEYQVVDRSLPVPVAAEIFAEKPLDVLLVYDKEKDHFLGCMYLHDFNKAYADPPKHLKGKIHNATIADVMNTSIEEIEWTANVSQAWALVTTKHPHGIIMRDEKNRFAGFLSNEDLTKAKRDLDVDSGTEQVGGAESYASEIGGRVAQRAQTSAREGRVAVGTNQVAHKRMAEPYTNAPEAAPVMQQRGGLASDFTPGTSQGISESPEVISAPVGSFLTDLKKSGDVKHHPLAWAIALLVVAPGVILGVQGVENGAEFTTNFETSTGLDNNNLLMGAEMLFDFLIIGQLILGPGVCAALARRRHLGPAVFVAMGSSAVLLISNQVIKDLAIAYDAIAALACIACMAPLIIVLRNKRVQLPAGRARHTWAFLMSVSILMFASATMVAAIQHMESPQVDNTMAWSSLLLVAGAIGWAWPKGRHIVEEVAEEIIEQAV